MTNYRFTKGNELNKIVLRDHKVIVSHENLTDELAEIILNTPGMEHNIELIPGRQQIVSDKKKEEITGEVKLPESIVSALKEAGIEKRPLKVVVSKKESIKKEAPAKEEAPLVTSKPSTEKEQPKKKGKR